MVSINPPKMHKIQAWALMPSSLCSPMSQDRPRVPQDAKVEAPSMPNDKLVHTSKIHNLEAMSSGREPAAESVAHKIS